MSRGTLGFIPTATPLSKRLSLSWSEGPDEPSICVSGWTAEEGERLRLGGGRPALDALAVYPAELLTDGEHDLPAMAGAFAFQGDSAVFVPRHPLVPGTTYRLMLREEGGGFTVIGELHGKVASQPPVTTVTELHPTSGAVPLNHLRFYLHFSNSMSEGQAARSVRLRDAGSGEELRDAILPMPPELWDHEHRRLTVLLDPGRIKRGLAPHNEAGYPLVEGRSFIFEVDADFRDAEGRPMQTAFTRKFAVGPAIRERIDPSGWQISPPPAGSSKPVRVKPGRVLDRALGERCVWVQDADRRRLDCRAQLVAGETVLELMPAGPWQRGSFYLAVDPVLEDCAGNSVARPFDRDLADDVTVPHPGGVSLLEFRCE